MFKEFYEFDIAGGLYFWLQHNWVGMDNKYESFCKLTQPGMYKRGGSQLYDDIEDCEIEVYNLLNNDNYKDALDIVLNYKSED